MSNPLYYQWLAAIAERDQAMLFIALTALAGIGIWLGLRGWARMQRIFVYTTMLLYWVTLFLLLAVYFNLCLLGTQCF
jgi:hypothetical protein